MSGVVKISSTFRLNIYGKVTLDLEKISLTLTNILGIVQSATLAVDMEKNNFCYTLPLTSVSSFAKLILRSNCKCLYIVTMSSVAGENILGDGIESGLLSTSSFSVDIGLYT